MRGINPTFLGLLEHSSYLAHTLSLSVIAAAYDRCHFSKHIYLPQDQCHTTLENRFTATL